ncbi:MAG: purine-nucleoside phosphorylase [Chthoniobacterales bacterium]
MSGVALKRLQDWGAETAIVLGSGLNALVAEISADQRIAYANFEDLPFPTVPGHAGQFVLGALNHTRVIYAQGRVHLYEGHSARGVTAGIRLLASAGVKRVILTNAAGSANPQFAPGSWMMITDHLNFTGTTPLLGAPEFVEMTAAYSSKWRAHFAAAAREAGVALHEGIYAGLLGPQYETAAEVRMLRQLGADAIGMSTVLETIQARALGLEVAGFSCLTNSAAGMSADTLSHAEVLTTGKAAAADFSRLLSTAITRAPHALE